MNRMIAGIVLGAALTAPATADDALIALDAITRASSDAMVSNISSTVSDRVRTDEINAVKEDSEVNADEERRELGGHGGT